MVTFQFFFYRNTCYYTTLRSPLTGKVELDIFCNERMYFLNLNELAPLGTILGSWEVAATINLLAFNLRLLLNIKCLTLNSKSQKKKYTVYSFPTDILNRFMAINFQCTNESPKSGVPFLCRKQMFKQKSFVVSDPFSFNEKARKYKINANRTKGKKYRRCNVFSVTYGFIVCVYIKRTKSRVP